MGCRVAIVTTDERPIEATDDAVLLPLSNVRAIPLAYASAAGIRQQLSAGILRKDVENAVSLERCPDFL